jgi:gamma-glutamylcyclotransferase (GGCT)/AIG2-like uncharacterized protein YtfP
MGDKLFVYGTLTNKKVQKEVIGRELTGTQDILIGYAKEIIEIDGKHYPCIVPNKAEEVLGLIVEVSDDELSKIDAYETSNYKRKRVVLMGGTSAWTYMK